jgi:GNAT superfamily N-acetyltransferase
MLQIRPYVPADRAFMLSLAPRLVFGRQAWRDEQRWLTTVECGLTGSIDQHNQKTQVLIAQDEDGHQLGFATVSHRTHFTGQPQASIGKLATSEIAEGRGVGTALVAACAQWARAQGYPLLTVSTGAATTRALRLYHHLGFCDEDVTLTKRR